VDIRRTLRVWRVISLIIAIPCVALGQEHEPSVSLTLSAGRSLDRAPAEDSRSQDDNRPVEKREGRDLRGRLCAESRRDGSALRIPGRGDRARRLSLGNERSTPDERNAQREARLQCRSVARPS